MAIDALLYLILDKGDFMQTKKILWVSSHAPFSDSGDAGGKTFYYYYNGISKQKQFEIRLISIGNPEQREKIEQELYSENNYIIYTRQGAGATGKIKKIKNIDSLFNPWNRNANLISNYCADEIIKTMRKLKLERYCPDIIIMEWTNTVVLAGRIKRIYSNAKLVASEHDVTFVGYQRKTNYFVGLKKAWWGIKYKNEKKIEMNSLRKCDLILPHNPSNIELLRGNGIDSGKLHWLVPFFNNMSFIQRKSFKGDILFYGAMSRPENYLSAIWFIKNVMPLLKDLNIRFVVVGNNPPDELRHYECERIHITGYVDLIAPYFENAMCFVAPLVLGAGIKVKILEAMSSGIPVITNAIGIEGIPANNNVEYVHCESSESFEKAIRSAYRGELDGIGHEGRKFICKTYNLEKSLDEYIERLNKL